MKARHVLAAAVGAALAAMSGAAAALEVELSGQLNRGIMHVDDGVESDVFHVDNDNSSTRVRLRASEDVSPGLKAGVLFEVEYQSSPSNVVDFADRNGPSPEFDERYVDIFFEGGFGRASLGQGDGAANGAVEVDLSGTTVAHYADIAAIGGGFEFRTPGEGFGPAIAAVLSQQDFESRYDRVRYDTPSFGGFGAAVSHGVKDSLDVWETAVRYNAEVGALGRIAAALGYSEQEGLPGAIDDETIGGSASWLHPSGINLTLGHTNRDLGERDAKFTYAKVGYKWGKHAVSADYAVGDDQAADGDEGTSMSVAYVFTPIRWAELFGLAKQAELDRSGASFDDIRIFMVGTRLRF